MMASRKCFLKVPSGGCGTGRGGWVEGKIKCKSNYSREVEKARMFDINNINFPALSLYFRYYWRAFMNAALGLCAS